MEVKTCNVFQLIKKKHKYSDFNFSVYCPKKFMEYLKGFKEEEKVNSKNFKSA